MATHFLREHRRGIFIAILVPIIVTFIYWGAPIEPANNTGAMNKVATAAGEDITVQAFVNALNAERDRMAQFGQDVTVDQLVQSGQARQVLQNLIDRELLRDAAQKAGYTFDREFLAERLKDDPYFRNDDGTFNADRWNTLVQEGVNGGWDAQYDRLADDIRFQLFIQRVTASARVIESELQDQFKENYRLRNTKVVVKQAAISPPINPTEEEVKAKYDEDPSLYEKPEERMIEYVSWSLEPPMPPEAEEIVKRARGGEDFEALVAEFSEGPFKESGGDIGTITRTVTTPEHQLPVFDLEVGGVTDPIRGPSGVYIFKVEEKTESEITDALDVKVRQILLMPQLPEDELAALEAEAEAVADKVLDGGSFADFDKEAKTAGPISIETNIIEGIPAADTFTVRGAVLQLDEGMYTYIVRGTKNLYVAKVTEVKPPEPRPFEVVKDEVRENLIASIENSNEYRENRTNLAMEMVDKVESFDDIKAQYPELELEVNTLPEFSAMDYDFQAGGPLWQATVVIEALKDAELGELVGPIQDFRGIPHFVSLVSRTTPEEGAWKAEWEEQKEQRIDQELFAREQERLEDYLAHLRLQGNWTLDEAMFAQILATSAPPEEEPPADTMEDPAVETPAETEAPAGEVGEDVAPEMSEDIAADILGTPPVEEATEAPAEPAPAETAPAETAPAETAPAETAPAETAPEPAAESEPADAAPES